MKRGHFWKDRLGMAIGIWFCVVPFLFFVTLLFFDVWIASTSLVVAFVVILLICNVICRFQSYEEVEQNSPNRKQAN